MHSNNKTSKSKIPALQSVKLLDQVRERIAYKHYSLRTEQAYVYWVRWFIRWSGLRHPRDMGAPDVERLLIYLVNDRQISSSTHRQALSALLFLYREAPDIELPRMSGIGRPKQQVRLPVVLTPEEVQRILLVMVGVYGLIARVLYGTGMRIMETLSLRVKDLDFERRLIIVRHGKGDKDRTVMLPDSLREPLLSQCRSAQTVWAADRAAVRVGQ